MGVGGSGANVTTYGWDGRNNPTSAKLPTGATSTATGYQTIAGADLPGSMTTADNEKTNYTYDTAGNTKSVAVEGTGGGNQSFDYNPATPTCQGFEGQRCRATTKMTSTKSVSTTFTYDAQGNLKTVTAPAPLGTTTYTYDGLGRTTMVKDAREVTTLYEYDNRDRVTKVDSSNYATVTLAQRHPGRPRLLLPQRDQGRWQDPHQHGRGERLQDLLHLRQRGPLLLRQGGEGHRAEQLLAVLLRPGRQPHLPGHHPRLPTGHHLHDQRRPAGHREERLHGELVL